jgi:hypothetical protein
MAATTRQYVKLRDQGKGAVYRYLVELLSPDGPKWMISSQGSLHGSKAKAKAEAKRLAGIYRCDIVED